MQDKYCVMSTIIYYVFMCIFFFYSSEPFLQTMFGSYDTAELQVLHEENKRYRC